jgi:purine-nucleoside phosphorylase
VSASHADAALAILRERGVGSVAAAVILGSGLAPVAADLEASISIPYADLPGFPLPTVEGHPGTLKIGILGGQRVACLVGRGHYYEHGDAAAMRTPIDLVAALGAAALIVTCAAGSLRADLAPGSLALVTDHINLSGMNPLIGATADDRFVGMVDAYDPGLRAALGHAAARAGVRLGAGVYMWFAGPSFETPAEIRMAQILGADLVGMSLVPEVILARRVGLRVAGLAAITNFGAGFQGGAPSHAETQARAADASVALQALLMALMEVDGVLRPAREKPGAAR